MKRNFVIGSRGSALALWQTDFIKTQLEKHFPQTRFETRIIKTTGDAILDTALSKIGDKGLFTKQIETALIDEEIDLAIHSLKDLPTVQPDGLRIGAVSHRETPNDVFISKNYSSITDLPENARIATGSLRRRSQLLNFRADLEIVEIRGNVPTRIEKFLASELDGMILAFAGVHRLKLDAHIKQIVPTEILLPAVGQGVMAIEIRETDAEIAAMLAQINDPAVEACITAERAFLRSLEGGCQVPIGGFAVLEGEEILLQGFVGDLEGKKIIRDFVRGKKEEAEDLGKRLAEKCLQNGAAEILRDARNATGEKSGEVV
ncbi:MAG TPA: hydroxymethylbilane synthase [Pyrinomonadaceae bacterium]|nr:hydroxymethylbilane synthase [Pyrinomonadaceae bacterium]